MVKFPQCAKTGPNMHGLLSAIGVLRDAHITEHVSGRRCAQS